MYGHVVLMPGLLTYQYWLCWSLEDILFLYYVNLYISLSLYAYMRLYYIYTHIDCIALPTQCDFRYLHTSNQSEVDSDFSKLTWGRAMHEIDQYMYINVHAYQSFMSLRRYTCLG